MSSKGIPEEMHNVFQRINALHEEATKLGMFIGDRELITCPKCGLMKDVDVVSRLLTYHPGNAGIDSGLRFEEIDYTELRFRCPSCGTEIKLDKPTPSDWDNVNN